MLFVGVFLIFLNLTFPFYFFKLIFLRLKYLKLIQSLKKALKKIYFRMWSFAVSDIYLFLRLLRKI